MSSVIVDLIPLMIGAAVVPVWVIVVLLLLRSDGGLPGGTGQTFDWTRVRAVREKASFLMLAGGLNPGNVHLALTAVRPDGVDVSSGVEAAPGRKDPEKVRAFMAAVREAER